MTAIKVAPFGAAEGEVAGIDREIGRGAGDRFKFATKNGLAVLR